MLINIKGSELSSGSRLWAVPSICDAIMAHFDFTEQQTMMSLSKNAFLYVVKERHERISGNGVGAFGNMWNYRRELLLQRLRNGCEGGAMVNGGRLIWCS